MPISLRVFILDESGRLSGFTKARWKRLWDGKPELPARAGQAVRFLEVPIETRNGRPVAMGEVRGLALSVDRTGCLEAEQRRALRPAGKRLGASFRLLPGGRRGRNVPVRHDGAGRHRDASPGTHWTPTAAQMTEVKGLLTDRSGDE